LNPLLLGDEKLVTKIRVA